MFFWSCAQLSSCLSNVALWAFFLGVFPSYVSAFLYVGFVFSCFSLSFLSSLFLHTFLVFLVSPHLPCLSLCVLSGLVDGLSGRCLVPSRAISSEVPRVYGIMSHLYFVVVGVIVVLCICV